jgi:hypothetical protein
VTRSTIFRHYAQALVGVARASLEELLQDYEDFLRQRSLRLWGKDHEQARAIRKLAYAPNRSYRTYRTYSSPPPPPHP